jgi:hypothetical protein
MSTPPALASPSTLDQLRGSDYMKLMEYTAGRIGNPFTSAEAISAAKVSQQSFDAYVDILYAKTASESDKYSMTVDAVPRYIEFLEFQQARDDAIAAKKEATNALTVAIIAIIVSGLLAIGQIAYQAFGSTKLDSDQINALLVASSASEPTKIAIEATRSPQLEALHAVVEANHQSLVQAVKDQINALLAASSVSEPTKIAIEAARSPQLEALHAVVEANHQSLVQAVKELQAIRAGQRPKRQSVLQ